MFLCLCSEIQVLVRFLYQEGRGLFLLVHTVEALFICDIVDKQNSHGATIISGRDCSEALLSGGIPYLQFHALAIQVNSPDLEIYPDGGDETRCEAVFAES